MMMQTEQPNADLFKSTLRGSTLHGKHRGGGTLGTGAQEALEAARAAAAKEKDITGANTSSDARKRRKKKRGSGGGMQKKNSGSRGGGFEITVIDSNAPAHHRIQADPLKEDDDGEYGDESFDDDDDGYEDDFEVVGNAKPSRPKDSAGTGMVTVDVTTDVGFEATLINKKKGSKNASDRKSHRKSSADAFNETATSRAGLPGARRGTDEYATDDEVAQRTAARGLGISDDNLPPLQPSRGSVATGRGGGRGFSPLSSPPSGYVSDAVVSPLPNIKRRR